MTTNRVRAFLETYFTDEESGMGEVPDDIVQNLPINPELVREIIQVADGLIASRGVRSTAAVQALKVKLDAVVVLSQSREQELTMCLQQACNLLQILIDKNSDNLSLQETQHIQRFLLELNFLSAAKPL